MGLGGGRGGQALIERVWRHRSGDLSEWVSSSLADRAGSVPVSRSLVPSVMSLLSEVTPILRCARVHLRVGKV